MMEKLSEILSLMFSAILALLEVSLFPFAIFVFFNPLLKYFIPLCALIILLPIIIRLRDLLRERSYLYAFSFLFNIYVMLPAALIVFSRVIGHYSNSYELTVLIIVALLFIIPVTYRETHFFLDNHRITYPISHYERLGKYEHIETSLIKILLKFMLSTAFLRLVLLLVIIFTDYIIIRVPYVEVIYSGIILSLAYDAFFVPLIKQIKKRKITLIKNELIEDRKRRDENTNVIIENCFREASNSGNVANKFIDLLSVYEGGLKLSDIERINARFYVYIKKSCSEFFEDYPYMPESEITTTYLYVWSKNKTLKDVPNRRFGF